MASFVPDTHALVWHLVAPRKLGRGARRAFTAADAGRWTCYVPAVALIEAWLLHERGRLRIGPPQLVETLAGHPGYTVLPVDMEQAIEFGTLPRIRDPMDRMIVAAARVTGSRLVTTDAALAGHGAEVLWD